MKQICIEFYQQQEEEAKEYKCLNGFEKFDIDSMGTDYSEKRRRK